MALAKQTAQSCAQGQDCYSTLSNTLSSANYGSWSYAGYEEYFIPGSTPNPPNQLVQDCISNMPSIFTYTLGGGGSDDVTLFGVGYADIPNSFATYTLRYWIMVWSSQLPNGGTTTTTLAIKPQKKVPKHTKELKKSLRIKPQKFVLDSSTIQFKRNAIKSPNPPKITKKTTTKTTTTKKTVLDVLEDEEEEF
jgi:hypothetical protein